MEDRLQKDGRPAVLFLPSTLLMANGGTVPGLAQSALPLFKNK